MMRAHSEPQVIHGTWFRVIGPEGLHELFEDERAAVLRAMDWAGAPIDESDRQASLDELYDRLELTLDTTGEFILVCEAG